ncbi:class I SAM-dependent methyltransferase, partial [bacterium]|nr:class I SAM-dependent methyltransferase [bacterium]
MSRCRSVILLSLLVACAHAAAPTASADVGARRGLVVVVGCGDPKLLIDIARRPGNVVHGVDTRADRVAKALAAIRAAGLSGNVSASTIEGGALPFVDNAVNVLVVAEKLVPPKEASRVLAPGGMRIAGGAATFKSGLWGADEWTHHMYDASGIGTGKDTVVSQPRSMQWKAGPEYARSHENMSSVSALVSAGGRVFSIMDEGPKASVYLPPKWFLTARDAFSGVRLWQVPIGKWHARLFPLKSGPLQLPRRLVAMAASVYVTLGIDAPVSELYAPDGTVRRTFADTAHAQ